jgi:methyl-accepting chemotaxis protein
MLENFKRIKIGTKIIIPVMFFIMFGTLFSAYQSSTNMKELATEDKKLSLELLTESVFQTLRLAMNTADPEIIKKTENEARDKLKGLDDLSVAKSQKTISMYSPDESFTTDPQMLHAFKTKEQKMYEEYKNNSHTIKIVKPMIATSECLMCHSNHMEGDVVGVISLTFSLDDAVERVSEASNRLLLLGVVSLLLIVAILFVLIKKATNPIVQFKDDLNHFFNYLSGEKEYIKPFNVVYEDEVGEMVMQVNENIQKTVEGIEQDRKVIEEMDDVMTKVKNGFFDYRMSCVAHNPNINILSAKVNDMIETLGARLQVVNEALIAYGNADFSHRLEVTDVSGKIASISQGTIAIGNNVSELLAMIKQGGDSLSNNIETLASNANELSVSANEQASSLEETAASIEEIAGTIKLGSENATEMNSYAIEVTKSSKVGVELANQTAQSMDEIDEQVKQISEAITVIDQIAFQTNILSLNAAVEAATAGEAGKGFAVVAGEVRNLANRSAEAAKVIQEIVTKASDKAHEGKGIAIKMKDGFDELNENIDNTIRLIEHVSTSTKQQHIAISQINDSISNIDQITHKNAAAAHTISSLSNDTKGLAMNLINAASYAKFRDSVTEGICDVRSVYKLNQLKLDHISFKDSSFSTLNEHAEQVVTNHHECKLGAWIDQQEQQDQAFTKTQNWQALKGYHEKVHSGVQSYVDQNAQHATNSELQATSKELEENVLNVFKSLNVVKAENCNHKRNS